MSIDPSAEPVLTCIVAGDVADIVSAVLFGCGALAVGEEETSDGVELRAGFRSEEEAHAAAAEIADWTAATVTMIRPTWPDEQRAGFEPLVVGPWFVSLPEAPDVPPDGLRHIRIDPGRSFGHGAHPSTHLVLQLMATLDLENRAVLDVGTGSGVLAIAAASLGAHSVAIDTDPTAVACAEENARRNAVGDRVEVRLADGGAGDVLEGFDLTLVNVTIDQHRRIAAAVHASTVVISGLLEHQLDEALGLYGQPAMQIARQDGWSAAVLGRT